MIYLNGQFLPDSQAKIAYNDRGFLLSDGLFETIRVYQGKPFALKEHWARLKKAADTLELPIELSYEKTEKIIAELLKINSIGGGEANLRLTITRGTGPRGLNYPDDIKPTVMIAAFPYVAHTMHPAKVSISTIRRNEYSPLATIKSLSYLDNVLARREVVKHHFDEAILLNTKGHVAEASAANIFLVTKNNTLVTPRLDDGALPGITRQMVLKLAAKNHIRTEERSIHPDELFTANEIFLTNSIIEIQAVGQIQDRTLCCDKKAAPITHQLQAAYQALVADMTKESKHEQPLFFDRGKQKDHPDSVSAPTLKLISKL